MERGVTIGMVAVGAMVLVALCELARATAPPPDGTGRRWALNGLLYVLEATTQLVAAPLVTALTEAVAGVSPLAAVTGALPWWCRLVLGVLVLDAAAYGLHRASHRILPLWRLHAIHHSDRALDVTTTVRHHPIEGIPAALVVGGCGALLGLTPWEVALYGTLAFAVQLVAHAELRLPRRWVRVAGLVLVTPEMHCLHHSRLRHETDTNYGQMFSFWDRLFGTFALRAPAAPGKVQFGLDQYADDRFHTLRGALLQPLARPRNPSTAAAE